jgi:hypothetical protein
VAIPYSLLNSEAYKSLTGSAAKLLPYFIAKPKKPINQDQYIQVYYEFTYSEAKKLGFAPKTFKRALDELIAKGFIEPVWKGGLRSDSKTASRFKCSKVWMHFGTDLFKPFNWDEFYKRQVILET